MQSDKYVFLFSVVPSSGKFDEYNNYNYTICKVLYEDSDTYTVTMKYSTSYLISDILQYPNLYCFGKDTYKIERTRFIPAYFVKFTYIEAVKLIGMHLTYNNPDLNLRSTTVITEVKEQDDEIYINNKPQTFYINNSYYTLNGVPFGKPTINKPYVS
jgi:hypothetical protein